MDSTNAKPAHAPEANSRTGPPPRLELEAQRIAEARAELDAGFYVDSAEIGAWIDSIGTDQEMPPPATRRR